MSYEVLRTGAIVYLENYGEFIRTDLKKTGNVYHFYIESEQHISRDINEIEMMNLMVTTTDEPRRVGRSVIVEDWRCHSYGDDGHQHDCDYEGQGTLKKVKELLDTYGPQSEISQGKPQTD